MTKGQSSKKDAKSAKSQSTPAAAQSAQQDETIFDPIKEFEDDDLAYDVQYYNEAIFAQHGSKEDLRYPYLIFGYINCCPVDKNLKGLAPLHIAQSYLFKDMQPIYGKKSRDYFESVLLETGYVEIQH